jgi:hypothetical protein
MANEIAIALAATVGALMIFNYSSLQMRLASYKVYSPGCIIGYQNNGRYIFEPNYNIPGFEIQFISSETTYPPPMRLSNAVYWAALNPDCNFFVFDSRNRTVSLKKY